MMMRQDEWRKLASRKNECSFFYSPRGAIRKLGNRKNFRAGDSWSRTVGLVWCAPAKASSLWQRYAGRGKIGRPICPRNDALTVAALGENLPPRARVVSGTAPGNIRIGRGWK